AGGRHFGRGRFGVETTVAGPDAGLDNVHLAFETEDAAIDQRLFQKDTGIVDQVTGGKIVAAVDDHVVVFDEVHHVFAAESLAVGNDVDIGIERLQGLLGRFDLGFADAFFVVQDLALQIGAIDDVVIDDPQGADTGCGEVVGRGGTQAARTHQEDLRFK